MGPGHDPRDALSRPRRTRSGASAGFTLLEVLMALLIAMIGLIGTVAVQQAVMSSTLNANDAAVAMRLASARLEEYNAKLTVSASLDHLAAQANGSWTAPVYVEVNGYTAAAATPTARFARRERVANLGATQPYAISVEVTYALDSGTPRTVRLDQERRKTW